MSSDNKTVFDINEEGKSILLHEKWNDGYKLESDCLSCLFPIPWQVLFSFFLVLWLAHMVLSWYLIRKYFHQVDKVEWTKRIPECLWAFVCPPLYLDWDQGGESTTLNLIWPRT